MPRTSVSIGAILAAVLAAVLAGSAHAAEQPYLVGRGMADITGPPVGIMMLGYVRPDQIAEGLHLRQYARTFIVAEPDGQRRVAVVTTDLQSVTHSLVLSVLDQLQSVLGDVYRVDNVIIAATHTHAVPGGYWQYGADTALGTPFHPEHYQAIVDGIAESMLAAHRDLSPGRILIAEGEVEAGGANRSRTAYLQNPEQERQRYSADVDTHMTLLKFVRDGRPIGQLNWHAVHPTSMSQKNRLISSDNKGYAAYAFERAERAGGDDAFVAAFAQSNCGDVTPNLTLDQRGPGKDEFESTKIMGTRQCEAARRLFDAAEEEVAGAVDMRAAYVDLSCVPVADAFTGCGEQSTCPSAYGYSFAAGSNEDGGGQPLLFREGMTKTEGLIERMAKTFVPLPPPSDELRRAHQPKPILFAIGAADPPALPNVLPLGVARIGQLAIVVGPAEYTTMSGRRFRDAVKQAMPGVTYVAVAGYANDYCGYVATREEYEVQHYEGASTLFGPWTQAAYQQEFARLAADLAAGRASPPSDPPLDVRRTVHPVPLGTRYDEPPPGDAQYGDAVDLPEATYPAGSQVVCSFWSGHPQNGYEAARQYAVVERQVDGRWQPYLADGDWEVKVRWKHVPEAGKSAQAARVCTVEWDASQETPAGMYRVVHRGVHKTPDGEVHAFAAVSREFAIE
ncbi:MAG: hypothetical protein DWQ37_22195 [Planctomycetota bacterium]|nr:MAG: hypothetical protein DWQ37_22195 [Planctomycetota bacterium]